MATGLRLELRQSQQLVMTPQLQQAIRLLQMSHIELGAFVADEIERNPLLTAQEPEAEGDAPPPEPRAGAAGEAADDGADRRVTAEGDMSLIGETFDTGAENLYDAGAEGGQPLPGEGGAFSGLASRGGAGIEDDEGFEQRLTRPCTLREHLAAQIGQSRAPVPVPQLALALVEELDEAGYLRADPAAVAERLGAPPAAATAALRLLQSCDPTGVGARSLAECLALQLTELNRLDPAMETLIGHLDMLAAGQIDRLRKLCGVDAADFSDMLRELRALDPRPGAAFAVETVQTVVPDVFVRRTRWGGWSIELNPDALPRVLIDQRYAAELARGGEKTREFLSSCRETATWLIKSLDQRARTILKVSTEIVRQQDGFFEHGVRGLRPLSLRMVADAIGMHESTVSRVTSNKYLSTERGILEFKFFFSNAVGGLEGTSAEAVRSRVRDLVAAERPDAVLSDDQIVEILQQEGIDIARRTVAKYRSSLGIPSSVERRRRQALREAG